MISGSQKEEEEGEEKGEIWMKEGFKGNWECKRSITGPGELAGSVTDEGSWR